jgi:TorA maturation chaperone TorD
MKMAEAEGLTPEAVASLEAAADVLDIVIRLHDREADAEVLDALRDTDVAGWFDDLLSSSEGQTAAALFRSALEGLPAPADETTLDALAAEYADIYLTHGYRISPSGSVWLTEDHLERQMPMFDVRDWYAHYDITVPDWRVRADDHLVHELQFLSFLLRRGSLVSVQDAARFMDLHVLPWVPVFLAEGRPRLREDLYRALFDLTGALLEELRDQLEGLTGQAREARPGLPAVGQRVPEEETAFMPGASESW